MPYNTLSKILTLYFMFTHKLILSQEPSEATTKLQSNKQNECLYCKVLTDSFNTWLHKTSRGKHEGGDVAWEEAKLKSYSRSEMRLVEIQEGLCSDLNKHKDHCYVLAAEAEHVLEKWWFKENYDNEDLYSWLCIEHLQYCCPPYHFGEACTPCHRDEDNKICSDKGKCDGDGTRKGNGTCICKKGYSGHNCESCAPNFYNATNACNPCHKACNECHNDGPQSCIQCAVGWNLLSGVCMDVNECLHPQICKASEFCINKDGSYACKSCDSTCRTCVGPGAKGCTSCKPGNVLWFGRCMLDEHYKNLFNNAILRAACYLCLLFTLIFILRKALYFASLAILLIASVVYYYENSFDIRLMDLHITFPKFLYKED